MEIISCTIIIKMKNILCKTVSQLVVYVLGGGKDGRHGCMSILIFIVFKRVRKQLQKSKSKNQVSSPYCSQDEVGLLGMTRAHGRGL